MGESYFLMNPSLDPPNWTTIAQVIVNSTLPTNIVLTTNFNLGPRGLSDQTVEKTDPSKQPSKF